MLVGSFSLKFANLVGKLNFLRAVQDHVCTLHMKNKKDAVISRCLDRKEVHYAT